MKLLFTIQLLFLASLKAQTSSCPLSISASITCEDGTTQLSATSGYNIYSWTPATGLSNTTVPNPVASPVATTLYTLTASMQGVNLVANPDFSAGNTGFTSGMNYSTIYSPGNYSVGPNWFGSFPSLQDHTSTSDNMYMAIDGSNAMIWEQTISNLLPNTNYSFSFWASKADQVQPIFEIHFIGNSSGDNIEATVTGNPYMGTFAWDQYGIPSWNSGSNTSLTIRIINLESNSYGNDFGMDDFLFETSCSTTATITVEAIVTADKNDTIPNIFTPNSDGLNDVFKFGQDLEIIRCRIYNRWGLIMGELDGSNEAWDGRTTSGMECPDGFYFYILEVRRACSGTLVKTGYMLLNR